MYYEKLALEVGATVAGLEVVKPPEVRGASGIDQRFTFLASESDEFYAFDVCNEVGEREIIQCYLKKMDTGARTFVVCLSGRPKGKAQEMAKYYGIEILGPKEVGDFFSKRIERHISAARPYLET